MSDWLAVIRVRGSIKVQQPVVQTLRMLRLYSINSCVVLPKQPVVLGMLQKVKDYVTWGEVDEQTLTLLLEKRGRLPGKTPLTDAYMKEKMHQDVPSFVKDLMAKKRQLKDVPGLKPFLKLHPPVKGFERKGLKTSFAQGGVLGYRKDKINELLARMV